MSCTRGCCATPAEHYKSLVFATGPVSTQIRDLTRQFDADMDAYPQLRAEGIQPQRVSGSAELLRREAPKHVIEGTPPPEDSP
jgi:hypothetical protein